TWLRIILAEEMGRSSAPRRAVRSAPPCAASASRAESLPGRVSPEPELVDQQDERRRQLPAARIVEVVARERRAPVPKYAREAPLSDVGLHHVVQQARQP